MHHWTLDEGAYAGPEHLDPAYVATYEQKAGFDPVEDIEILRREGLNPSSVVVDMGAGTGVFTAAVAPLCRQVIAVDVSPAMTEALRAKVGALLLGNVTVVQAGFLSYDHQGGAADFVFSRNALHQIPDFWKGIALGRVASMLRQILPLSRPARPPLAISGGPKRRPLQPRVTRRLHLRESAA